MIDVKARFARAFILKDKSGDEIKKVLELLFNKNIIPKKIWSDHGSEFYNKKVQALLKKYDILLYSTYSPFHNPFIERFNRTLKMIMWKYFTANNTRTWIDILLHLVDMYNNKKHSSIQMKPKDAYKNLDLEQSEQSEHKENKEDEFTIPKYDPGAFVRIARQKNIFEKEPFNWSMEIFKILEINTIDNIDTYILEDLHKNKIEGSFYEDEIQKTKLNDIFLIEKIIRTRSAATRNEVTRSGTTKSATTRNEVTRSAKTKGVKNKKHYFVKWLGYPTKFNSWITEDDIVLKY